MNMSKKNENDNLDKLIFEGIIEQLKQFDKRLTELEDKNMGKVTSPHVATPSLIQVRNEMTTLKVEIAKVNERASNMRIDRQVMIAMKRIFNIRQLLEENRFKKERELASQKLKKERELAAQKLKEKRKIEAERLKRVFSLKVDILIICPSYPGGTRAYGGEFVQKRVEAYKSAGLKVAVLEVSNNRSIVEYGKVNGIQVIRINPFGLQKILSLSMFKVLAIHSIEKPVWSTIKLFINQASILVFVHGFEARDWKLLKFNYSKNELKSLRSRLNQANTERRETMSEIFKNKNINVVFVSEFMKTVAQNFAKTKALNSHIIHNSISQKDFPYIVKSPEDRKKVLWVRSFSANNYSNDISRDVILQLSKKPYFSELKFSIYGNGRFFNECTDVLKKFDNIDINQKFINTEELRELHSQHGLMLVPTRWDSQGLTCGEAMSSGLVPLTTNTAAIPEFTDNSCAVLAPFDDVSELVKGFDYIFNNPNSYLKMSKKAAKRSQSQCGVSQTLNKEILLIKPLIKKAGAPKT
jgi:glycosyltransferase involved in cell wall biosynthesis